MLRILGHLRARPLCSDFEFEELKLELPPNRHACNPSVAVHRGEVWCSVRVVNYRLNPRPQSLDPDCMFRTTNYLMRLNDRRAPVELVDPVQSPPVATRRVRGLEDLRLFSWRDRLWALCTVPDRDPGRPLSGLLGVDEERLVVQFHFPGPEKNWVPLVSGQELFFLHSTDPTRILRCDPDSLLASEWSSSLPPWPLRHLRGSSQAIPFDGGWLYVAHEVVSGSYLHRFVQLDAKLRVRAFSKPFFFLSRGVEFCCGLCPEPGGSRLLLGFGHRDRRAFVGKLALETVRSALRTPPARRRPLWTT